MAATNVGLAASLSSQTPSRHGSFSDLQNAGTSMAWAVTGSTASRSSRRRKVTRTESSSNLERRLAQNLPLLTFGMQPVSTIDQNQNDESRTNDSDAAANALSNRHDQNGRKTQSAIRRRGSIRESLQKFINRRQERKKPRVSENNRHDCDKLGCEVVRINISGQPYEIRIGELNCHPQTLLGDPERRVKFYCPGYDEFFFDRHRPSFEAIFNYYHHGARIRRPPDIPSDIFDTELNFYDIEEEAMDEYRSFEGQDKPEEIILPENECARFCWQLFEYPSSSNAAYGIGIFSCIVTVVSIVLFIIETLPIFGGTECTENTAPNFLDAFFLIESFCTLWFTLEFLVRIAVCPCKILFIRDIRNTVDIAAFAPYYITLFNVLYSWSCTGAKNSASLAFLRVLRLTRIFKLTRHSAGLQVLILTFKESLRGLAVFFVALTVSTVLFSSCLFIFEKDHKDSKISSIPDAFWWAIITMCTVGYGDKVPVTVIGKIIGSVCAVSGVLTLAIPMPIVSRHFDKFYRQKMAKT